MKYKLLIFFLCGALLAMFIVHCNGNKSVSETGIELKKQYDSLQNEYIQLKNSNVKIDFELKKSQAALVSSNEEKKQIVINYAKTYVKGRGIINNNPCNDSLHLASYDTLNANCERVQAYNDKILDQYRYIVNLMQSKINNLDSTVNNRNAVIALDKISIAATRDTLSNVRKTARKRVIKSFFIGVGVGAAAREAVNVAVKLADKK